jgi:uncharacterized membrane protein YhaH (DUF805 family)
MFAAIKHNLTHLLDFAGRDARSTFWYYALFVFLLNMAVSLAVSVPVVGQAMTVAMQTAQSGEPAVVNKAMAEAMAGTVSMTIWAAVIMGGVNIVLLAAAFVRRLHDADFSGWWALLVGGLYAAGLVRSITRIPEAEAMARLAIENGMTAPQLYAADGTAGLAALIGWVPTLMLIGFGVLKSSQGANRFGEAPVRS